MNNKNIHLLNLITEQKRSDMAENETPVPFSNRALMQKELARY